MAVSRGPRLAHWDGAVWSLIDSPNASRKDHVIYGIDCASPSNCWAVGAYIPESQDRILTLAVRWDGVAWDIVSSPIRGAVVHNYLEWGNMDCVSESDCWVVGFTVSGIGIVQTLTQHWDGISWTVVPSPNLTRFGVPGGDGSDNRLYGVDCVSSSDCWAVGYHFGLGGNTPLILRWDGATWSAVSAPTTGTNQWDHLMGVACASASRCVAVGYNTGTMNTTRKPLVVQWNGTAWTLGISANFPSVQDAQLTGATCPSESNCWAVGYFTNNGVQEPLIQRWDGVAWLAFPVPNLSPTTSGRLTGVTCTSALDCWAVGQAVPLGGTAPQTLTLHWNGAAWSAVPSGNTNPARENILYGVACTSSDNCWSVGHQKTRTAFPSR